MTREALISIRLVRKHFILIRPGSTITSVRETLIPMAPCIYWLDVIYSWILMRVMSSASVRGVVDN